MVLFQCDIAIKSQETNCNLMTLDPELIAIWTARFHLCIRKESVNYT